MYEASLDEINERFETMALRLEDALPELIAPAANQAEIGILDNLNGLCETVTKDLVEIQMALGADD